MLVPIQASIGYPSAVNSLAPGYPTWDDASLVVRAPTSGILSSQDEYNLHGAEGMLTLKYFIKSIFSTINLSTEVSCTFCDITLLIQMILDQRELLGLETTTLVVLGV